MGAVSDLGLCRSGIFLRPRRQCGAVVQSAADHTGNRILRPQCPAECLAVPCPVRGAAGCAAAAAILSQRCIGGHAVSDGLCHRRLGGCGAPHRQDRLAGHRGSGLRARNDFSPLRAAVLGVSADGGMAAQKAPLCLPCSSGGYVCSVNLFDDKDGGSVFRRRHGFCRCAAAFAGPPDSGCAL